jgi:hypothetical protein
MHNLQFQFHLIRPIDHRDFHKITYIWLKNKGGMNWKSIYQREITPQAVHNEAFVRQNRAVNGFRTPGSIASFCFEKQDAEQSECVIQSITYTCISH